MQLIPLLLGISAVLHTAAGTSSNDILYTESTKTDFISGWICTYLMHTMLALSYVVILSMTKLTTSCH